MHSSILLFLLLILTCLESATSLLPWSLFCLYQSDQQAPLPPVKILSWQAFIISSWQTLSAASLMSLTGKSNFFKFLGSNS